MYRVTMVAAIIVAVSGLPSATAQERVLIPLLVRTEAAFGSDFVSHLRIFNSSEEPLRIAGVQPICPVLCALPEVTLLPKSTFTPGLLDGAPGRVVRLLDHGRGLHFSLRVQDLSRQGLSAGIEVPVVREEEFRTGVVYLVNVPAESSILYRNMLRVYAYEPVVVTVRYVQPSNNLVLREEQLVLHGGSEVLPYYSQTTNFPESPEAIRVEVHDTSETPHGLWAFTSTTNNQTQEFTIVTPQ